MKRLLQRLFRRPRRTPLKGRGKHAHVRKAMTVSEILDYNLAAGRLIVGWER